MRWVAFSSIFAGLTGYVIIFMVTSTFGAGREVEIFNVFWGLFFAVYGVLNGIMHETTRAIRSATGSGSSDDDPTADALLTDPLHDGERARPAEGARPIPVGAAMGLAAGGLVLASSPLWADTMLGDRAWLGVLLASVALAIVAVQATMFGQISGSGTWSLYGKLLALEALLRLVVAGIAMVAIDPLAGFLYATVAGVLVAPTMLLVPGARDALRLRADVRRGEFVRRCLSAMLAASATAVLVVGFPVLIKAARPDTDPVVLANLLLAVTLTRAPILVPLTSFQNAIVVYFVDRVARGRRVLWSPIAIVLGVGAIGAALAWVLGPPIIAFMGEGFSVGGAVLAALTFAAGVTGVLFLTGAAVLARERHGTYVAGWWTAAIVAMVLLVVMPGAVVATVVALTVGPAVGAAVHVVIGMRGAAAGDGGGAEPASRAASPVEARD